MPFEAFEREKLSSARLLIHVGIPVYSLITPQCFVRQCGKCKGAGPNIIV